MPSCEYCGCKVGKESVTYAETKDGGVVVVYVCGKAECKEQAAEYVLELLKEEREVGA
jgi:hypothetical protein